MQLTVEVSNELDESLISVPFGCEKEFIKDVKDSYVGIVDYNNLPYLIDYVFESLNIEFFDNFSEAWYHIQDNLCLLVYGKRERELNDEEDEDFMEIVNHEWGNMESDFFFNIKLIYNRFDMFYIHVPESVVTLEEYESFTPHNSPLQSIW